MLIESRGNIPEICACTTTAFDACRGEENHAQDIATRGILRFNKGGFRSWLFKIGKVPDQRCPCGHHTQDGTHITCHCPTYCDARDRLLRGRSTWEDLDTPVYIQDPGTEEATEEFFTLIFPTLLS